MTNRCFFAALSLPLAFIFYSEPVLATFQSYRTFVDEKVFKDQLVPEARRVLTETSDAKARKQVQLYIDDVAMALLDYKLHNSPPFAAKACADQLVTLEEMATRNHEMLSANATSRVLGEAALRSFGVGIRLFVLDAAAKAAAGRTEKEKLRHLFLVERARLLKEMTPSENNWLNNITGNFHRTPTREGATQQCEAASTIPAWNVFMEHFPEVEKLLKQSEGKQ